MVWIVKELSLEIKVVQIFFDGLPLITIHCTDVAKANLFRFWQGKD
jgi:hypothetical protein